MAFTLLTKKGNKQQLKTVGLPSDSALVINTRNQREAEREEQQQLKQLVLEYEVREEANQRAGTFYDLRFTVVESQSMSRVQQNSDLLVTVCLNLCQHWNSLCGIKASD